MRLTRAQPACIIQTEASEMQRRATENLKPLTEYGERTTENCTPLCFSDLLPGRRNSFLRTKVGYNSCEGNIRNVWKYATFSIKSLPNLHICIICLISSLPPPPPLQLGRSLIKQLQNYYLPPRQYFVFACGLPCWRLDSIQSIIDSYRFTRAQVVAASVVAADAAERRRARRELMKKHLKIATKSAAHFHTWNSSGNSGEPRHLDSSALDVKRFKQKQIEHKNTK